MARQPETEKKTELARAAVEVLQREGTDVSMAQLADALGIKRPTLLYHFPTHGDVVEAALQDLLIEQSAYVLERVERHAHPVDRLFAQVQAVHAFHQGRERRIVFLTQAIAATAGARADAILEAGSAIFEAHRRAAADRIRDGIEQGVVAPCDADALVDLVRSVIDGLMVQRVVGGLDFAPVHALLWERLLAPLKLEARRKPRPSSRTKKSR